VSHPRENANHCKQPFKHPDGDFPYELQMGNASQTWNCLIIRLQFDRVNAIIQKRGGKFHNWTNSIESLLCRRF
jgi:hypothetical protein